MSVTITVPRNTPRSMYEYLRRMARCSARAIDEGGFNDRIADMIVYGTSFYTPEQQKIDHERTSQLMKGLK